MTYAPHGCTPDDVAEAGIACAASVAAVGLIAAFVLWKVVVG